MVLKRLYVSDAGWNCMFTVQVSQKKVIQLIQSFYMQEALEKAICQ